MDSEIIGYTYLKIILHKNVNINLHKCFNVNNLYNSPNTMLL